MHIHDVLHKEPMNDQEKKQSITMRFITDKILIVVILFGVFGAGYQTGEYRTTQAIKTEPAVAVKNFDQGNTYDLDFSLFWEAWNSLENQYVDKSKLDPQKMYYGAIRGMVASLDDSYTFFLTPEENEESKRDLEGTFFGIGAELGLRNNAIVIVAPLKGSPAENAGLKPGDIILKVDGKDTANWTLFEAVAQIRGERGTKVVLTIARVEEEDSRNIAITRDEINIPFVETTYEDSVAIVELSRFGDQTNDLWDKAVGELERRHKSGQLDGVVIDMRSNPGGYLQSAVHIASEFVEKDKLIVKQEYADMEPEVYTSDRNGRLIGVPVVILQNEGSASASEIVAGSLRDNVGAKIVGTHSFGKGTVQVAEDLRNGAGIHITISKWILPKGDWIQEGGIKPDIAVDNDLENGNTLTREADKQLDAAITAVKNASVADTSQ